ncbi:MAG TPA: SDR family oxidoreductase [Verrucomicrobiae bacterium]|nr:SDR family oxidoreductase [Verrucomicrobiae bacterium]
MAEVAAKTALITGVSSGIGRVTAERMARRGWNVAGTAREPAALGAWAAEHRVVLLELDVTDEARVAAAVAEAAGRFGGIDVLMNNAGYGVFGPLEGTSAAEIDRQIRTNLLGAIAAIRHVMPVMRRRGGGVIVNVSSLGGRIAAPFGSLYYASKFAIEGLSESLRYEASLHGIRVKLVEPAHFKTGFMSRSLKLASHPEYARAFDNFMEWARLEDAKAPSPEPVAEAILRAAEDPSPRLRYPVHGALLLALTAILPDGLWRSLNEMGMSRRPKKTATPGSTNPAPPVSNSRWRKHSR